LKLKIAILGTRGIPNSYGGFEQAAQFISAGLVERGHDVTVYNSELNPYKENKWKGVDIVHCKDPENWLGTVGQFIYDLNCVLHARKQSFDVWIFFGYTSSSIWGRLYPRQATIISNMDGLEWKRSKYARPVQRFLQYAEKLAIKYSEAYIADSVFIQSYLKNKYQVSSKYIPYGAEISNEENKSILEQLGIEERKYFVAMARMEPENNIEIILKGFTQSNSTHKFLVIGNHQNKFGRKILKTYKNDPRIIFIGALFDQVILRTIRKYCLVYFHGHSVGGTNPSLLEAMADKALIAAHDNSFNRAVLGNDVMYFSGPYDTRQIVDSAKLSEENKEQADRNFQKIKKFYSWGKIITAYETFILQSFLQNRSVNKVLTVEKKLAINQKIQEATEN